MCKKKLCVPFFLKKVIGILLEKMITYIKISIPLLCDKYSIPFLCDKYL